MLMVMRARSQVSVISEMWWARLTLFVTFLTAMNIISNHFNDFKNGPILCTFRLITGLPCPFCGTTRGLALVSQGRIIDSVHLNPLAVLVTALFLIWAICPNKSKIFFEKIKNYWWMKNNKQRYFITFLISLIMWLLNLSRMITH